MTSSQRSTLAGGLILILLGLAFLAGQLFPGIAAWLGVIGWPWAIILAGAALLLIGVVTNTPSMAVPACIVGGIGLLLAWQNQTGRWDSWSYAWALIPGFVGVGTILAGLWAGKWEDVRGGLWLILISALLFVVFGSFLGGLFGGSLSFIGRWWPVLLILLGVLSLIEYLTKSRRAA